MQSSSRSAGFKYGIASWARTPSRQRAKSSGSTRIATNLWQTTHCAKTGLRLSPCTTHPLFPAGHPGRPQKSKTPPDQAANGLRFAESLQRLQSHSATSSLVSAQATVLFSESVGRPRPGRSGCLTSFIVLRRGDRAQVALNVARGVPSTRRPGCCRTRISSKCSRVARMSVEETVAGPTGKWCR